MQVRSGDTGEAVRGVQEEFQFRNLSGDPSQGVQIDGIFGPKTDEAVRGFQQALGLSVDGIVGPLTWRALVSGMLAGDGRCPFTAKGCRAGQGRTSKGASTRPL